MGAFANFRDVIKGLKHEKSGEAKTKLCPKCTSPRLSISSGPDTYPRLYGITPGYYICSECGYKGPIVLEQIKEDEKKG